MISETLQLAEQYHHAGEVAKAESLYRQVLQVQPNNADALHLLGLLAYQTKRHEEAEALINQAIAINPVAAIFYNNLGNVYRDQGKLSQATECFRQALRLEPNFPQAYNNLGNVQAGAGQFTEAVSCYQQALVLNPNYLNVYSNLGVVLGQMGKFVEATECYQRALTLNPNDTKILNNLGYAYIQLGKVTESQACFQRVLQIDSDSPDAHNNLGNTLKEEGKLTEAEVCFRRALQLDPTMIEAYNNLGNVFKEKGKLQESIACYRRGLQIKLEAKIHSNLLFNLHYLPDSDRATLFSEHQQFSEHYELPLAHHIRPHLPSFRSGRRRLKIGYLSPDFREHSVAYFMAPILAHHDRQQFEIYCYHNHLANDSMTQQLQQYADHWITSIGLSDEALAEQIRQDQIDILVDLTGHTAQHRLLVLARRPAPIQMTYLGYSSTTGMLSIDYRITDNYADPEGMADPFSSETLIRMPHSYFCYHPGDEGEIPIDPSLPVLQNGYITFGSFNNYAKLSHHLLQLWAEILHSLPQTKLLIKARNLRDLATQHECQERFTQLGISPDRIILTGYAWGRMNHLSMYNQVDIALDTFPYHGATTTCETLWMGTPVVTLVGENHVSRMGLSILTTVGIPEWIAYTEAEYINICLRLAKDINYLQQLRATLREKMRQSPLMDAISFTRQLEANYRKYVSPHPRPLSQRERGDRRHQWFSPHARRGRG